ncbi:cysteine-rich receptor-like protein kinase 15 [Gossypium australe]|uniref:non-specific serine/threonine protein kinase n=1 Tax=Gossypium australe TaxID=47621 RepID=A0A5B6WBX4_9ROSI|nr:cysteine-rich receptor-like protein kinase 15 [Gossypium australe]
MIKSMIVIQMYKVVSLSYGAKITTNFINLVLLLTVLSLLSPATEAQQHRLGTASCPNTTTFTINSTYQANRDTLLSSLSSNVTRGVFFYNTTAGKSPDMVYGLFLCRGDISTRACQACVIYAATHISRRCPLDKTAVVWYEECFLRYSNRNIFSVVTETPTIYFLSGRSSIVTISEEDRFEQFVLKVINETIAMAESRPAGVSKYVTRFENISSFQTLYIKVDCTPDLSGADCGRCLRRARAYIPAGRQGGRAFNPSCNVRYEFNPFFNLTAVAALPAKGGEKHIKLNRIRILITSLSVIFGVAVVFISGFFIWRRNSEDKENIHEVQLLDLENEHSKETFSGENWERSQEFPSIQLDILHAATDHFSDENKLGEGGFGPVYKGTLANGKEIAVKRLSRTSGQGLVEFKNEVLLIARLQHKNLVRLLGCCLEKNEKLLVYEFMPNRSLDVFLFDSNLATQLDWQKRFNIIKGIARGIMYLHEDSRLRIIHRDLKASNVLLDHKMNPKISDFGMARIFCEDINQANTNRVVGT